MTPTALDALQQRGTFAQRTREEIAAISMLTCMGGCEPQLDIHIHAGLNVGLTKQEIEEIIIQTVPYTGFPTAINAMNVLKKIRSYEHDCNAV